MRKSQSEYKRQWYLENRDRISAKNRDRREHRSAVRAVWGNKNKEYLLAYGAKYRSENRDKLRESSKAYARNNRQYFNDYKRKQYHSDPQRFLIYNKNWQKKNADKHRATRRKYVARRLKQDLNYKLRSYLRSRIHFCIKNNVKSASSGKLLGCSIDDLKIYLESKFEVGMSWQNYGRNGWHVDHIIPCSIFDLSKPDHQKRCFHFSNLQPLWEPDNIRKSNHFCGELISANSTTNTER